MKQDTAIVLAIAAGVGALLLLSNRSPAAPAPLPTPPPTPTRTPTRPTASMTIVPLQDPRVPLTNTNDPAKDRLVTQVLSAQLDALHAPAMSPVVIRATSYLASKGSPAPSLPTQADVLYWAAQKINDAAQYTFYRTLQ